MPLEQFYSIYQTLTPDQRKKTIIGKDHSLTIREIYLMCRENERTATAAITRIQTLMQLIQGKDLQFDE